jgi:hypothetical protein
VVVNGKRGCIHNGKGSPPRCILAPIFVSIYSRCFGVYMVLDLTYGLDILDGDFFWIRCLHMTLHYFKKGPQIVYKKHFRFSKHYVMNQEERSTCINLVPYGHSRNQRSGHGEKKKA